MSRRRRTLTLTPEQRTDLEHARDHDPRPYLRERAAAVLKIADGMAAYAVARVGLLKPRHPETVYDWLNRYEADGLAGLRQHPRGHRGLSPPGGRDRDRGGTPAAGPAWD